MMDEPAPTTAVDEVLEEKHFGRRQATGLVFGVLGVALIVGVAPNISGATRAFAFEPPPDALEFSFHPPTMVVIFALIYLVAAGLSFLPAQHDRFAARAQILAAAVTVPLILVIALALSQAPTTNVTNLFDESLVLGHTHRSRIDDGSLV